MNVSSVFHEIRLRNGHSIVKQTKTQSKKQRHYESHS